MQRCRLFKLDRNLSAGHCVTRLQAVLAVSEPTSPALWFRLFKWGLNLPPWHCQAGCRLFKGCQFLPPEQVRWAKLDILLYFYVRTDQVKPGHMQLLRSAFFFLLREIFSV